MSRSIVQPVGQKRLTNVAVVRLKKRGNRFEIACYKNKVLSWRSGIEKDLDEVLQSETVYTNVSKGVLAKSKDLIAAFGMDNQAEICLDILEKGELQVAGKERESALSSQFKDVATLVMEMTINPETHRPYTTTMIERLMHEIHFKVDPNHSSKKQALNVIRELQNNYPIKRSPMKLRLTVPEEHHRAALLEQLGSWSANIVARDVCGSLFSITCEIEPSLYRECDAIVRNMHGRTDILAVNVHLDSDTNVDYDGHEEEAPEPRDSVARLSENMNRQSISSESGRVIQKKCTTCDVVVGDAEEFREHFKSDWHKHNMRRKSKKLTPLTAEQCVADSELEDSKADRKDYSF